MQNVSTCQDALLKGAVGHQSDPQLLALVQQPRLLWIPFKHIVLYLHQDTAYAQFQHV